MQEFNEPTDSDNDGGLFNHELLRMNQELAEWTAQTFYPSPDDEEDSQATTIREFDNGFDNEFDGEPPAAAAAADDALQTPRDFQSRLLRRLAERRDWKSRGPGGGIAPIAGTRPRGFQSRLLRRLAERRF